MGAALSSHLIMLIGSTCSTLGVEYINRTRLTRCLNVSVQPTASEWTDAPHAVALHGLPSLAAPALLSPPAIVAACVAASPAGGRFAPAPPVAVARGFDGGPPPAFVGPPRHGPCSRWTGASANSPSAFCTTFRGRCPSSACSRRRLQHHLRQLRRPSRGPCYIPRGPLHTR